MFHFVAVISIRFRSRVHLDCTSPNDLELASIRQLIAFRCSHFCGQLFVRMTSKWSGQIISIHDMLNTTTNYLNIIRMATEESNDEQAHAR